MPRYHFIRMARTCHVTFLFIWWKCLLKMSELHPVLRWGLAAMQYRAVSFWEDIFTNKCGPILTYKTELGFLTFSWELSIYYPKLILKQWFLYNKNERLEYNCLYGWKQNRTKHHTRFFFFFLICGTYPEATCFHFVWGSQRQSLQVLFISLPLHSLILLEVFFFLWLFVAM